MQKMQLNYNKELILQKNVDNYRLGNFCKYIEEFVLKLEKMNRYKGTHGRFYNSYKRVVSNTST